MNMKEYFKYIHTITIHDNFTYASIAQNKNNNRIYDNTYLCLSYKMHL